tara:strand:+ start:176 stop:1054 length:879 start_codon:yes stop_codon:yes gene_type:complete
MKNSLLLFFVLFFFDISAQSITEIYINKFKSIAKDEMKTYNIPASITLSQGILESGNGLSRLASEANNHFGIKCHSSWIGETILYDDDEDDECFRKYSNAEESYRDHSLFLTTRGRYSDLFNSMNYKKWARGLLKAGYATNPDYDKLLIDIIEKYSLDKFDDISEKQFYLSHYYGFPYVFGLGSNYFIDKFLINIRCESSYIFNKSSISFSYNIINFKSKKNHKIYIGANSGVILYSNDYINSSSIEISYLKSLKNNRKLIFSLGADPLKNRSNKNTLENLLYQYFNIALLF